jgi:hypothetical protein
MTLSHIHEWFWSDNTGSYHCTCGEVYDEHENLKIDEAIAELEEGFIAHMSEICKVDSHDLCGGWLDTAKKDDPCHCYCHREARDG